MDQFMDIEDGCRRGRIGFSDLRNDGPSVGPEPQVLKTNTRRQLTHSEAVLAFAAYGARGFVVKIREATVAQRRPEST
jgi:hypothetical protein